MRARAGRSERRLIVLLLLLLLSAALTGRGAAAARLLHLLRAPLLLLLLLLGLGLGLGGARLLLLLALVPALLLALRTGRRELGLVLLKGLEALRKRVGERGGIGAEEDERALKQVELVGKQRGEEAALERGRERKRGAEGRREDGGDRGKRHGQVRGLLLGVARLASAVVVAVAVVGGAVAAGDSDGKKQRLAAVLLLLLLRLLWLLVLLRLGLGNAAISVGAILRAR